MPILLNLVPRGCHFYLVVVGAVSRLVSSGRWTLCQYSMFRHVLTLVPGSISQLKHWVRLTANLPLSLHCHRDNCRFESKLIDSICREKYSPWIVGGLPQVCQHSGRDDHTSFSCIFQTHASLISFPLAASSLQWFACICRFFSGARRFVP